MSKRIDERKTMKPLCKSCGEPFSHKRRAAGYILCMPCGEKQAMALAKSHCVVPMHKSNYMYISDPELLKGINNKGGKHGL